MKLLKLAAPLAALLFLGCDEESGVQTSPPPPPPSASDRPSKPAASRERYARKDYLLGVGLAPDSTEAGCALLRIDPASGRSVAVGDTRVSGVEDMVVVGDGDLIAVVSPDRGRSFSSALIRFDPEGETWAKVGVLRGRSGDVWFVGGLANADGTIYGSAAGPGSVVPDAPDRLIKIGPRTATATEVGPFGPDFLNVQDLAYHSRHGLIGVDFGTLETDEEGSRFRTTPALLKIDAATGRAEKIADLPPLPPGTVRSVKNRADGRSDVAGPFVLGIEFAPDGTLYGSTVATRRGGASTLVTIDPATGALREVGPLGFEDIGGLQYVRAGRTSLQGSSPAGLDLESDGGTGPDGLRFRTLPDDPGGEFAERARRRALIEKLEREARRREGARGAGR